MAKSRLVQKPPTRPGWTAWRPLLAALAVAGLLATGLPAGARQTTEIRKTPRLLVAVEDGLLSVDAAHVPLADLLRAVGRKAGLVTRIHGPLASPLEAWSLREVPLAAGIMRLAGGNSVALRPPLLVIRGDGTAPEPTAGPPPYLRDLEHRDPAVRLIAIETLANARGGKAAGRLGTVLREDEDAMVRAHAASLIADIANPDAADALATGLGDEDSSVREHIVSLLGGFANIPATMALGQAFFGERDTEMRRLAVRSLALQRSPAARHILETAARDGDEAVRDEAVHALALWD